MRAVTRLEAATPRSEYGKGSKENGERGNFQMRTFVIHNQYKKVSIPESKQITADAWLLSGRFTR